MITLHQPLQRESHPKKPGLVFWLCEPFDDRFSFRVPLAQVQEVLNASAPTTIAFPPERPAEDFVEGELAWGTRKFAVYLERSLGYMHLSSSRDEDIAALAEALALHISVNPLT